MNKIKRLWYKYQEIIRYVIVGGMTTAVSLVLFYGSTWLFLDGNDAIQLQVANVISWVGAVAFAYVTNRIFVFQSKNSNIIGEAIAFTSSRVLTLFLDMGVMFLFSTIMGWNYTFTKIISMVLVTVGNYVISKLLVFRKEK